MMKKAISVTLSPENWVWLQAKASVAGTRGVSRTLDAVLTRARKEGQMQSSRSVVGTIAVPHSDQELADADGAIRTIFAASLLHTSAQLRGLGESARGPAAPARPATASRRPTPRRRTSARASRRTG